MDPNACLALIGSGERDGLVDEAIVACEDLRAWLVKGGFEPDWSRDALATNAYRAWLALGSPETAEPSWRYASKAQRRRELGL